MDKNAIKVRLCVIPMWVEKLRHQAIKRSRGTGKSLGENWPPPKHTAWSTNRCKRDITCSHEQLMLAIDQVECTVHCTSCHVVLKNVLFRNGCLCRYSGRIKLIISVHNTPLVIRFFDTIVGVKWRDLLSRTITAACLARKKSSMMSHCS